MSGYVPCLLIDLCSSDLKSEIVDLHSVKWSLTRKNSKPFLPFNSTPPVFPLKKVRSMMNQVKYVSSQEHKVKCFADDLSFISRSSDDHQAALSLIDSNCTALDLEIRPDKCYSLALKKGKPGPICFSIHGGSTRSISNSATKFLGQIIGASASSSKKQSIKMLTIKLEECLSRLDTSLIRGDYRVWIYRNFVVPSLFFHLSVNSFSVSAIKKLQSKATCFLKRWLRLPRSPTLSILFHPEVLNLPYLQHYVEKAKLNCLSTISSSVDPRISELSSCLDIVQRSMSIPDPCVSLFTQVVKSTSMETRHEKSNIKRMYNFHLKRSHTQHWNRQLDTLSVQSKFRDIVSLEPQCKVWNRIISGLPAGQLSFLLRAGADCLPSPMNLRRWKLRTNAKCDLCQSPSPTIHHILSGCPTALDQGRLTWRHDSMLSFLAQGVKQNLEKDSKIFADLHGWLASESPLATLPADLSSSCDRPDIVVTTATEVSILELTVCANVASNFASAKRRKEDRYAPLIADLEVRGLSVIYVTLELGTLGHFTKDALLALQLIMPSTAHGVLSNLLKSLAKIAIGCSQTIFNARHSPYWSTSKLFYVI